MCGILGTLGFIDEVKFDPGVIWHRGPDGVGTWQAEHSETPAQLGHTRLSILDLSDLGSQPMFSADGRFVFVFNGEIYNFIELREDLERHGHVFQSDTDSEVFMTGLISYGPEFQHRCNGMWAFCLWDRRTRSALLGRDRFGKKPLYFSLASGEGLVFASEMKAIYPFLKSVEPDDKINFYLQFLFDYESTEETTIKGINRIKPGHYAEYSEGKISHFRWWNTLDHIQEVSSRYEDHVDQWRELFMESVRLRMRADVRIGTALSGGLDSSATFCAMAELADGGSFSERQASDWQHGFCAHYPGSTIDEAHWAETVTDSLGLSLKKVEVDPMDSGWSLMDALKQVEDPYLTLPTPMLATYKAIAHAGIKVTLDGHGADEMFSGYGHLYSAFRDATSAQRNELRAILRSLSTGQYETSNFQPGSMALKQRFIEQISSNDQVKNVVKTLVGRTDWEFINYKLRFDDQADPRFDRLDALSKKLYEIFHVSTLPTLLRNYDRYSMASGVEIRMPFMDHRLVAYTFSLPWTSKVGGTYTKRVLRDALKGVIPEAIRTRRDKIGWNAPLHEWMRGPLKKEIEETLEMDAQPAKVRAAWLKLQKKSDANFHDGQKVWELIMPILWRRSLADSQMT